jgi:hypothetical protein
LAIVASVLEPVELSAKQISTTTVAMINFSIGIEEISESE